MKGHTIERDQRKPKRKRPPRVGGARGSPRDVKPPGEVNFTNVGKLMFPEAGLSKGDLLSFYLQIAPLLLPQLRDRPITIERLPDGVRDGAPRFWQKNTPAYYPAWIPRVNFP